MLTSPFTQASRTSTFRLTTLAIVVYAGVLSFARIAALWDYYHGPMTLMYRFENEELPLLLNATGLLPTPLPPPELADEYKANLTRQGEEMPRVDLTPIKELGLRVCYGKEWYRFPGHYLIPDGIRVDWIKSEFAGQLPAHFLETEGGVQHRVRGTSVIPPGLNDLNKEEPMHYVSATPRRIDPPETNSHLYRSTSRSATTSSTSTSRTTPSSRSTSRATSRTRTPGRARSACPSSTRDTRR